MNLSLYSTFISLCPKHTLDVTKFDHLIVLKNMFWSWLNEPQISTLSIYCTINTSHFELLPKNMFLCALRNLSILLRYLTFVLVVSSTTKGF